MKYGDVLIIAALLTRETSGSSGLLEPFVQDAIQHFGASYTALVLHENYCGIHQWTLDISMSVICESGSSLVTTISKMSKDDALDMVIVPHGNLTPTIIEELWDHLLASKIVILIPKEFTIDDTKLQLDSNLYFYDSPTSTSFSRQASQFPENTLMQSNSMPQESYCRKQVQMVFAVLGFLARCIRSF